MYIVSQCSTLSHLHSVSLETGYLHLCFQITSYKFDSKIYIFSIQLFPELQIHISVFLLNFPWLSLRHFTLVCSKLKSSSLQNLYLFQYSLTCKGGFFFQIHSKGYGEHWQISVIRVKNMDTKRTSWNLE